MAETLERLDGAFALAVLFAGDGRSDDRGAPRQPARGRLWRRRDVPRLRRAGAGALHQAHHLSRGRRLGRRRPPLVQIFDDEGKPVERPIAHVGRREPHGRQGQPPPLHAEGDLRAAGGDLPHTLRALCRLRRPAGRRCRTPARRSRAQSAPAHHRRLRHRVLRRPDRQVLVRAARRPAGRGRYRLGVPLPRAAARPGRRWRIFISQSGETADTLAALRYAQGAGARRSLRDRQRPESTHRARSRRAAADAGRSRDRRRLDQGLHHPAHGAASRSPSTPRRRAGDRPAEEERADPGADRAAAPTPTQRIEAGGEIEALAEDLPSSRRALSRPRAVLSRSRSRAR